MNYICLYRNLWIESLLISVRVYSTFHSGFNTPSGMKCPFGIMGRDFIGKCKIGIFIGLLKCIGGKIAGKKKESDHGGQYTVSGTSIGNKI